jgi:hypothetical protein
VQVGDNRVTCVPLTATHFCPSPLITPSPSPTLSPSPLVVVLILWARSPRRRPCPVPPPSSSGPVASLPGLLIVLWPGLIVAPSPCSTLSPGPLVVLWAHPILPSRLPSLSSAPVPWLWSSSSGPGLLTPFAWSHPRRLLALLPRRPVCSLSSGLVSSLPPHPVPPSLPVPWSYSGPGLLVAPSPGPTLLPALVVF